MWALRAGMGCRVHVGSVRHTFASNYGSYLRYGRAEGAEQIAPHTRAIRSRASCTQRCVHVQEKIKGP